MELRTILLGMNILKSCPKYGIGVGSKRVCGTVAIIHGTYGSFLVNSWFLCKEGKKNFLVFWRNSFLRQKLGLGIRTYTVCISDEYCRKHVYLYSKLIINKYQSNSYRFIEFHWTYRIRLTTNFGWRFKLHNVVHITSRFRASAYYSRFLMWKCMVGR